MLAPCSPHSSETRPSSRSPTQATIRMMAPMMSNGRVHIELLTTVAPNRISTTPITTDRTRGRDSARAADRDSAASRSSQADAAVGDGGPVGAGDGAPAGGGATEGATGSGVGAVEPTAGSGSELAIGRTEGTASMPSRRPWRTLVANDMIGSFPMQRGGKRRGSARSRDHMLAVGTRTPANVGAIGGLRISPRRA
jgi:hypothetical protein